MNVGRFSCIIWKSKNCPKSLESSMNPKNHLQSPESLSNPEDPFKIPKIHLIKCSGIPEIPIESQLRIQRIHRESLQSLENHIEFLRIPRIFRESLE